VQGLVIVNISISTFSLFMYVLIGLNLNLFKEQQVAP
jgi:hypothetical protein